MTAAHRPDRRHRQRQEHRGRCSRAAAPTLSTPTPSPAPDGARRRCHAAIARRLRRRLHRRRRRARPRPHAQFVFADPVSQARLEAILHPLIGQAAAGRHRCAEAPLHRLRRAAAGRIRALAPRASSACSSSTAATPRRSSASCSARAGRRRVARADRAAGHAALRAARCRRRALQRRHRRLTCAQVSHSRLSGLRTDAPARCDAMEQSPRATTSLAAQPPRSAALVLYDTRSTRASARCCGSSTCSTGSGS